MKETETPPMSFIYDERIDGPLATVGRDAVAALHAAAPGLDVLHEREALCRSNATALPRTARCRSRSLPDTVEQVRAVLRVAAALGVPVVARRGHRPVGRRDAARKGLLLVMAKFNRILDIDPDAGIARVQPGVRNPRSRRRPRGLYYAPDPSSQIACSIGGNVAENAGGVHCLKYGLTVHNILKVEILTIDGDTLALGADALDAPGFDLLALFTGSEGMLGIVTEVTVKLLPKPPSVKVLMASFDDVAEAGAAVARIIGAG